MANTDIWGAAKALVGISADNDPDTINAFIEDNLATGVDLDLDNTAWSGYFAAAALSSAGYAIPYGYATSSNWSSYGQPATAPAVGEVMIMAPDADGYSHIGIIIQISADGTTPICLVGDQDENVVLTPYSTVGATYLVPVTPSATAVTQALAAGTTPAAAVSPTSGSSSGSAAAQIAQQLLASLLGGQQQKRQGSQIGNKDTPEKNKAREQSGPMPCGMQHDDVQGKQGKYSATKMFSPVSRLPTHEPFMGHATAQSSSNTTADGGGNTSAGGGGTAPPATTGSGVAGGTTGGVASGSSGVAPVTGSGGAGTSGTASQKAAQVYGGYKALGYNDYQIAALMGNSTQESNNRTNALNIGDNKKNAPTPIPGLVINGHQVTQQDSVGIGQWNGQRLVNLVKFANSKGLNPLSVAAQTQFVQHELATTEKRGQAILNSIHDAASLAGAATRLGQAYERFAAGQGGPRDTYAAQALNNIKNGSYANTLAKLNAVSTANSAAAATAAASAKSAAAQQVATQTVAVLVDTTKQSQGTGGGQAATVVAGPTLSKTGYDPKASGSKDPDQGVPQNGTVGATPQDGGSGSGGSGGGGGGSSDGTDTGGGGGSGGLPTDNAPLPPSRPADLGNASGDDGPPGVSFDPSAAAGIGGQGTGPASGKSGVLTVTH